MSTPNPNLAGKCYKATFQLMQDAGGDGDNLQAILETVGIDLSEFDIERDMRLVHGSVTNPSKKIVEHAWIEIQGQWVYDPVAEDNLPYEKDQYYDNYHCEEHDMQKVSRSEMARLLQVPEVHVWSGLSRSDIEEKIAELRPEDYTHRKFFEE